SLRRAPDFLVRTCRLRQRGAGPSNADLENGAPLQRRCAIQKASSTPGNTAKPQDTRMSRIFHPLLKCLDVIAVADLDAARGALPNETPRVFFTSRPVELA